jgi:hypothetical protein
VGLFGRARKITMALPGGRPWETPTGYVVRCDEVRVGHGAPVAVPPGLAAGDVAQFDAWARITILEPEPEISVWVHPGSQLAIGSEIWRVELIADGNRGPAVSGGTLVRRQPGQMVTLMRES